MELVRFPSPAIAYPRPCLGLANGQGSDKEASGVSGIVVQPDDLDHGVGQVLGVGKEVHSSGKHRETVLGIGMTSRFGQAAIGSARRPR
jgi:hypothetical protein